jgi:hypothetical protein
MVVDMVGADMADMADTTQCIYSLKQMTNLKNAKEKSLIYENSAMILDNLTLILLI